MSQSYQDRLLKVIPGGAHTYSRGFDQFPANAPQILARGEGALVYDPEGKSYLDYGMALRAVTIGYAEPSINKAAYAQMQAGNNLTRASLIELEAAERFVDLIDSVDMVKFTKNGSTAVSAAVKLARAYTGRTLIARCQDHPFFSYDDWFIGSTPLQKGIPAETIEQTKTFTYNDTASLQCLFETYPGQIACVVLEPSTIDHPAPSATHEGETWLHDVQRLCTEHGAVFVLDEMITGFRWHLKGAQHYYNLQPDLCTFGKGMANGYSVAAVAGKREIMSLGSIETPGAERLFLLSTTHGAEMSGLGAFVASLDFMQQHQVVEHLWRYGQQLIDGLNQCAKAQGVDAFFKAGGIPCSPYFVTCNAQGQPDLALRTLFLQEMVKQGVLIPWVALSYRHGDAELSRTLEAAHAALKAYRQALECGVDGLLQGPTIKPVFRQFN